MALSLRMVLCVGTSLLLSVCPPAVSPGSSVMVDVDDANTTNGSSVTFTCAAEGGPDNVFVWIMTMDLVDLGTITLSPPLNVSEVVELLQNTYTVLQQGSDGEYVIDSVNATENGGTYTCVVVNVAGYDSDEVELFVQPTITRQPENVSTFVGDSVFLSCEADSFPPPSYSWFRQTNDREIELENSTSSDGMSSGGQNFSTRSSEEEVKMDNSGSGVSSIAVPEFSSGSADGDGNFNGIVSGIIIINGDKNLFINGIGYSDAGFYFCRVSSSSGVMDSRLATITGTHSI